jgi:hypothetical protein
LICGARSCSGGFADRSSEAPEQEIARRVAIIGVIDLLSPARLNLTRDW